MITFRVHLASFSSFLFVFLKKQPLRVREMLTTIQGGLDWSRELVPDWGAKVASALATLAIY